MAQVKRLNTSATPERFKQSSGSQPSGGGGAEEDGWRIRALFWQPAAAGQQQGLAAAAPAAGPALLEEDAGPLTQLAASGSQSVAQAFCPHCCCFLSDVGGSAAEQRQHMDACAALAGPSGSGSDSGGKHTEQEDDQGAGSDCKSEAGEDEDEAGGGGGHADCEVVCLEDSSKDEEGGSEAAACSGRTAAEAELQAWLAGWGLAKYAGHFVRAGADLALLPLLGDEDLKQMGIAALGARKKLLLGASELAAGCSGTVPWGTAADAPPVGVAEVAGGPSGGDASGWDEEDEPAVDSYGPIPMLGAAAAAPAAAAAKCGAGAAAGGPEGTGGGSVGEWRALSGTGGATLFCGNIRRYFLPDPSTPAPGEQQQQQAAPAGGILQYFQPKPGSIVRPAKPAPPTTGAAAGPMAAFAAGAAGGGRGRGRGKQAAWAHKAAQGDAPGAGRRFGGGGRAPAQPVPLKPWHLAPGTPFVVDRFNSLPPGLQHRHWFLTHFHADHYKGITSKFDRGTIHCSPSTARLVQQQLRVPAQRLQAHPLDTPFELEGVRITFLDANHCPGAVMILFEPPGGARPVLHTGDCRLVPAMQQEAALEAVRGRCDLILDTTYCSPEYAFPTQAEVLQFSIDAVKAEAFNPKTLFLFGSYTIGKERLFLEAARVLQRKVYVSATKRKVLDCLDLPPEYSSLLTCNDAETNLHAVPLWMVTHKHMTKILKYYRARFTNVVGFQPTGWTHQRDVNKARARGRRQQKGTIITYQVPYSEHSSFTELKEFVAWLRPARIVPHVNTDDGGPKANRMIKLLRGQIPS